MTVIDQFYLVNGEGTIIRDGSQLHYFYARYTDGHDVGASVITYKSSSTNGDSWSEPHPAITPNDGKGRANACAVTLGPGHILLSYFVGVNHSSAVRVYRHTINVRPLPCHSLLFPARPVDSRTLGGRNS